MAIARTRGTTAGERARTTIAIAIGTLMLTWPAFFNGYPLVYDDSASYLDTIDPRLAIWARPIFYTLFLRPFHLHVTLWPTVFVQALILAHFVHLAARAVCGRISNMGYVVVMAALALTVLPWLTSMIMPHAFTGVVVLGLCMLGLLADRLRPWERWYCIALVAAAITFHMSHLALAACTLAGVLAVRLAGLAPRPGFVRGAVVAVPIALAALAQTAENSFVAGTLAFAPATPTFVLGRLIGDVTAVAYLHDACPQRKFALCDYLDQLPPTSDEFLWSKTGPFRRLGGPQALQDETRAIVAGTLRAYPLRQLAITARHVGQQLFDWRIDSIVPAEDTITRLNSPLRLYMAGMFPGEYQQFLASRVGTVRLPLGAIDALNGTVTIISFLVGAFGAAALYQRRESRMLALAGVLVVAWIGNSVVTASISGVFGHYQGRLAWLITFYAVAATLMLLRERVPALGRLAARPSSVARSS